MDIPVIFSTVGSRHKCAKAVKRIQRDKGFGLISNLKFTRIGWFTYHLYFEAEMKR